MSVDDEFEEKGSTEEEKGSTEIDGIVHEVRGLSPANKAELEKLAKMAPAFTTLMIAASSASAGSPCSCPVCQKLYTGGHVAAWEDISQRIGLHPSSYMHDSFVMLIDQHGPKAVIDIMDQRNGWSALACLVSDTPIGTEQAKTALAELARRASTTIEDPKKRDKMIRAVQAVTGAKSAETLGVLLDKYKDRVQRGEMSADEAAKLAVEEIEAAITTTPEEAPPKPSQDTTTEDTKMATMMNSPTMDVAKGEPVKAKPPMSGKWKEMGIVREGTQIVLPEDMTHDEAIGWIKRRRDEEMRTVSVSEEIVGYPLDAAIAFVKALQEVKGFISLAATPSFFGEDPPMMVTVEVGVGQTTQVPWGRMQVPGIEGFVETHIGKKEGLPILVIGGEVQLRFREEIAHVANVARRILRESSIYRAKAIRVRFPEERAKFDPSQAPTFMDVSQVREDHLIFPESVQRQVTTSIFTPIMHTDKCRAAKIPLKRGILLEGPYGCGKTLTANVTARKCQDNGWTFIYLDTVADLDQAIQFARAYQPACIFAEDIDRVVEGERTVEMDSILNTIDGVDTKSSELMVILTTNHVEDINRAMLRPGRLDAVIPVRAPDARAAERLVRQYGAAMLRASDDLTEVGKRLAGQIPAVIREVVERSKLSAVSHQASAGGELVVTADDLFTAADGMVTHLELLSKEEVKMTPGEAMAHVFADRLAKLFNSPSSMAGLKREAELVTTNGSHKSA